MKQNLWLNRKNAISSEKVFKNKQKIFEVIFSYKMQNFTIFKDYLLLIRNYFKKLIFLVKVNSKIISV